MATASLNTCSSSRSCSHRPRSHPLLSSHRHQRRHRLAQLTVVTDLQLGGHPLRLHQRRPSALGITSKVADLTLLAEELGVFFGVAPNLELARLEQVLGFVVLAFLSEEEGE